MALLSGSAAANSGRRQFFLVWLALAAVAVLAHFAFSQKMGLYEDDVWLVGEPMSDWKNSKYLWLKVKAVCAEHFQGRPLHYVIGQSIAYFSTHTAGLAGGYAAAAAVWVVNAGLCLALLWRRYGPATATTAALAFVLLPADTTHSMLHTVMCVHPAVTFLLLSGVAYSRERRVLSVLLAAPALLTYETCFLPALAWPLLFPSADRPLWRRCLTHGAAMGVVLAAALFLRVHLAEGRVAEAMSDKTAVAQKALQLAVDGPKAALKAFGTKPAWTVEAWGADEAFGGRVPSRAKVLGVTLGAGLAALLALLAARRTREPISGADGATAPAPQPERLGGGVRLILVGALMAALGYVAALNRNPGDVEGRMSSVHIGGTLGLALLFAGAVSLFGRLLTALRLGWAHVPLLAAYVTLLAGYHVLVQREYVRVWVAQGEVWKDVLAECPDYRPGTVILYPTTARVSPVADHQSWSDFMIYRQLFDVPPELAGLTPFVFPFHCPKQDGTTDLARYDWKQIQREGDDLYWQHWVYFRPKLEPGNVIVLRERPDGRLERAYGTVRMGDADLVLKPREKPQLAFPPNKLFWKMFPKGLEPAPIPAVVKP